MKATVDAGELFTCIEPTLEACKALRDKWLNKKAV